MNAPKTIFVHQASAEQQRLLKWVLSHGIVDAQPLEDGSIRIYSSYSQTLPTGEVIWGVLQEIARNYGEARRVLGY